MIYYLFHSLLAGEHYAYENVLFRAVVAALFCFFLVLVCGPRVIRELAKKKIGDRPEFDNAALNALMSEKANVPTMGGILIVGAIVVAVLLFADVANFYVCMGLLSLVWLAVLGCVDDWFKLTAKHRIGTRTGLKTHEKLLFQIGLAVVLSIFTYQHGTHNYADLGPLFDEPRVPPYKVLSVPFYKYGIELGTYSFLILTVLVMTFTSNAVNLTDGMDGLASGCVVLCSLVFMLLAYVAGDAEVAAKLLVPHIPRAGELAILCGAMMGSCLGFLWHNCHPARVFMGDTGSLPLGGVIGFVAIVTRQELMLFIVGGIFVIEAASVILQVGYFKLTGGKRLFRVAPIHHHFHMGGWSETQTVVRFWLVAAVFAGLALVTMKLR